MKIILRVAITLAVVALLGGLGYLGRREAMKRNWIKVNEYDTRSEGMLNVGDLAPDLEMQSADGTGTVKLSELYREKPVVMVFGSYT